MDSGMICLMKKLPHVVERQFFHRKTADRKILLTAANPKLKNRYFLS